LESASHALQTLEQETLHKKQPLVPVRPQDSKIVLTKNRNLLEIYIPPKGFSLELLPLIGITIIWNAIIWNAIIFDIFLPNWSIFLSYGYGGWFNAFLALLLLIGVGLIVQILFAFFGQIWFCLDQEKISLRYQLFVFKYYYPRPASRKQIWKLERTQTTYKPDGKGKYTKYTKVEPQINIWTKTKWLVPPKFEFGGGGLVSEIELDWLANELSDWLGLPVIRKE
jgi:hypothetical protein